MRLESVKELKESATQLVARQLIRAYSSLPDSSRELRFPPALGIHPSGKGDYQLAVHIRDKSYLSLIQPVLDLAREEIDVQITGNVYPQSIERQDYYKRPLCIGISISHSHWLARAGTLGCFVRKRGQSDLLILSNNHILANKNNAQIGDPIIQPAREDNGNQDTDEIASLEKFVSIRTEEMNFVDAAIALVKNAEVENPSELRGIGSLRGFYNKQELEDSEEFTVAKVGRKTGETWGRINALEVASFSMDYSNDLKNCRFNSVIAIEGTGNKAFSQPGDSGSIIVNKYGYAVALLFAGSDIGGKNNCGLTYAIPIDLVLDELEIELALT